MKIDRIRIEAFGPLSDLDTGPEPLPPMVVVHAPNEGGKSSFFVALSTLLYGFYPAGRDRHPYAPWSGRDAEIEARIRDHEGECLVVHRRLLSSPWGRVTRGSGDVGERENGGSEGEESRRGSGQGSLELRSSGGGGEVREIANRTLPLVAHVRRELFGDVFALTLGDLARVDEESWEEIQDRLLGAMGAEDVRSTRAVAQELDEEADALWRDDRRGKPEARSLLSRLKELDEDRRNARERDRDARATARRLGELRERFQATREERLAAEAVVERAETLGPVRSELLRIQEAETKAGDPDQLDGLPPRPDDRLRELEEEAERRTEQIARLETRVESLEKRAGALTECDRRLLDRATEVRALGKMAGRVQVARQKLPALEERRATLERRCREAARQLFSEPWDGIQMDRVRDVPQGELRSRIRTYRERSEEAAEVESELDAIDNQAGRDRESLLERLSLLIRGALAAAAGVGAVLLAWSLVAGPGIWTVAGATLLLNAGFFWILYRVVRSILLDEAGAERQREIEEVRRNAERARRRAREACRGVTELLSGLPMIDSLAADPDLEMAHLLAELQGHIESVEEVRRERAGLDEVLEEAEARLRETTAPLELDLPEEFLASVATLEARLDRAGTLEKDAGAARESLQEARDELRRLREADERETGHLAELRSRLKKIGDGDLDRGVKRALERIQARERARTFRQDLERRHPDLDALRRRIQDAEEEGEEWTADEEARVRARDRYKELNEREKELIREIQELEGRLRELENGPTLDQIEGEILQVREELDRTRRQRDRLALLAGVVRAADHRFRDRNQPDLLQSAGRHLETITGGRYSRLLMREGELSGTLYLEGPGYPHPVEVDSPISTGTREQVYLALRLAIIDHLDSGSERLPVFLDEAFVNWDAERRERAFAVLREVSGDRQIFVFTCHEPMARELEEEGARLIRLEGPE